MKSRSVKSADADMNQLDCGLHDALTLAAAGGAHTLRLPRTGGAPV